MNFRPLLVLSLLGFAVTILKSVGKLFIIICVSIRVHDNSIIL